MAVLKRILVSLCVGALLGGAIAILVAPGLIRWWYTPPATPAALSCEPQLASALVSLRTMVAISAAFGAVAVAVLAMIFRRKPAAAASNVVVGPSTAGMK